MTVFAGGFADKASLVEAVLQAQAATDDLEPYEQYSEGGSESGEEQPQFPEDDDEAEDHEDLDTLCECSQSPPMRPSWLLTWTEKLGCDLETLPIEASSSRVATGLL